MLDRRQSIRNLREVVAAELFLPAEIERTVVGGDDLKRLLSQSRPEHLLIVPVP
ncbi:hypothetical protein MLGJGCBP_02127 [Rhodococcus sp. T7]|nr:hypothetical protein MLGJGCBP_02127 [Rhodococcus sp. T7]